MQPQFRYAAASLMLGSALTLSACSKPPAPVEKPRPVKLMTVSAGSVQGQVELAGEVRSAGTDIIYCSGLLPEKFTPLARQKYPCVGHVGYLPVQNTWFGGPRAVSSKQ